MSVDKLKVLKLHLAVAWTTSLSTNGGSERTASCIQLDASPIKHIHLNIKYTTDASILDGQFIE